MISTIAKASHAKGKKQGNSSPSSPSCKVRGDKKAPKEGIAEMT
jgi:hypothetical protein